MSHNEVLIINGGNRLEGTVEISGAKNAALPLLAASLLSEHELILKNVPNLSDISSFKNILKKLGVILEENETLLSLNANCINDTTIDFDEVKKMRASILFLGPLLTRFGKVTLSLPGGCKIGKRPIDQHIKALRLMGAEIELSNHSVYAKAINGKLKGADVKFDMPTVTGTENIILAAILAQGVTSISGAACEPEISDLCKCLNQMGAKISGFGTPFIQIKGVEKLKPTEYCVIPDRIETGTFLMLAAATNSPMIITNTNPNLLKTELKHLKKMGAVFKINKSSIEHIKHQEKLIAKDFKTSPYPGFATDLQAQAMVTNLISQGKSEIIETIFDNRFHHVKSLIEMGAEINLDENKAKLDGGAKLNGFEMYATDLRASASLVIAALIAKGQSIIHNIHYLDRGYSNFDEKLRLLGADISRILKAPLPKEETFATNTLYAS